MNNNMLVIFTIDTENLPGHFQEILKHEQELIRAWKEAGYLEHFFLRPTKNGAVLVFKDVDEAKAKELMETLPLYPFVKAIEYLPLMKQF